MPSQWNGHYLDGRTPVRHDVTVTITRSGLAIASPDGDNRFWPLRELRQTHGFYAGEPVRLERGGDLGEALIVPDVGFLAALHDRGTEVRRLHDPRRRGRRLRLTIAAALGAVGLVAAAHVWGIPLAARGASRAVPVTWEERLGESVYERLVAGERVCVDADRQRVIDRIVATLLANRPSPYRLRVTVVDSPVVNAFALPGGRIVIMRGLLDFTESAEMLAGTLAHEIQHVLQRHTTRMLLQHASTGLLVAAVSGEVSGLMAFGLESARVLGALRYTRQAEEEADREGGQMLVDAGIDLAGDIAFFEKMAGERDGNTSRVNLPPYLSTHPPSRERAAALRELAARAGRPTTTLVADRDWNDVKTMCTNP